MEKSRYIAIANIFMENCNLFGNGCNWNFTHCSMKILFMLGYSVCVCNGRVVKLLQGVWSFGCTSIKYNFIFMHYRFSPLFIMPFCKSNQNFNYELQMWISHCVADSRHFDTVLFNIQYNSIRFSLVMEFCKYTHTHIKYFTYCGSILMCERFYVN